jgi:hypothetical protein
MIPKSIRQLSVITLLAATLVVTSCGGGGTTAGVGGSGIGGTGITATTVNGNVVQVVAGLTDPETGPLSRMAGLTADLLVARLNAQTTGVANIRVSGGGKESITDQQGKFSLSGVTPNPSFVLTLALPDGKNIILGIGSVPAGATVQVNNIVINKSQSSATPGNVEIETHGDSSGSSSSDDSKSGSSGSSENSGSSDDSKSGSSGSSGSGSSEDSTSNSSGTSGSDDSTEKEGSSSGPG